MFALHVFAGRILPRGRSRRPVSAKLLLAAGQDSDGLGRVVNRLEVQGFLWVQCLQNCPGQYQWHVCTVQPNISIVCQIDFLFDQAKIIFDLRVFFILPIYWSSIFLHHVLSTFLCQQNGKCVLREISGVIDISKAANSYNLWSAVWRLCQCHMRSIHHRVMTTPTSNIVVTFGIGNWDKLGWYLWFVLVSCSLGVRPWGRRSRFHHGRWGWRSSPSASNQVSSSQFLQLVKWCESGGSISQFAGTSLPSFFRH